MANHVVDIEARTEAMVSCPVPSRNFAGAGGEGDPRPVFDDIASKSTALFHPVIFFPGRLFLASLHKEPRANRRRRLAVDSLAERRLASCNLVLRFVQIGLFGGVTPELRS